MHDTSYARVDPWKHDPYSPLYDYATGTGGDCRGLKLYRSHAQRRLALWDQWAVSLDSWDGHRAII